MLSDVKSAIASLAKTGGSAPEKKALKRFTNELTSRLTAVLVGEVSSSAIEKLSGTLLVDIQRFYKSHLQLALSVTAEIIADIYSTRLGPCLKEASKSKAVEQEKGLWEKLLDEGMIAGLQDYVDSDHYDPTSFADVLYPVLCNMLTALGSDITGIQLRRQVCALLSDSARGQHNRALLMDPKVMGGAQLGELIASSHSYLLLDPLLELMARLMPPVREGKARNALIKAAFGCRKAKEVFGTGLATTISKIFLHSDADKWEESAQKILQLMANADSRRPQPFMVSNMLVWGTNHKTTHPMFVDQTSFVLNVEDTEDESLLVMEVPFSSINRMCISTLDTDGGLHICCMTTSAPLLQSRPVLQRDSPTLYTVEFNLVHADLARFKRIMAARDMAKITSDKIPKKISSVPAVPITTNWYVKEAVTPSRARDTTQLRVGEMSELIGGLCSSEPPHHTSPEERRPQKSQLRIFISSSPGFQSDPPAEPVRSGIIRETELAGPAIGVNSGEDKVLSVPERTEPAIDAGVSGTLERAVFGDNTDEELTDDDVTPEVKVKSKTKFKPTTKAALPKKNYKAKASLPKDLNHNLKQDLDRTGSVVGSVTRTRIRPAKAKQDDADAFWLGEPEKEPLPNVLGEVSRRNLRSRKTGGKPEILPTETVVAPKPQTKSRARLPRAAKYRDLVDKKAGTFLKRKLDEPESGVPDEADRLVNRHVDIASPVKKKARLSKENIPPPSATKTGPAVTGRKRAPQGFDNTDNLYHNAPISDKLVPMVEVATALDLQSPSLNHLDLSPVVAGHSEKERPAGGSMAISPAPRDVEMTYDNSLDQDLVIDSLSFAEASAIENNKTSFTTALQNMDMDVEIDGIGNVDGADAVMDVVGSISSASPPYGLPGAPVSNSKRKDPAERENASNPDLQSDGQTQRAVAGKNSMKNTSRDKAAPPVLISKDSVPTRKLSKAPWQQKDFMTFVRSDLDQEASVSEAGSPVEARNVKWTFSRSGGSLADADDNGSVDEALENARAQSPSSGSEHAAGTQLKSGRSVTSTKNVHDFEFEFEELHQEQTDLSHTRLQKTAVVDLTEDTEDELPTFTDNVPFGPKAMGRDAASKKMTPLPSTLMATTKKAESTRPPMRTKNTQALDATDNVLMISKETSARLKLDALRKKRANEGQEPLTTKQVRGREALEDANSDASSEEYHEQSEPQEKSAAVAIVEVLDAIRDVVVSNLNNKVAYVKSNVRVARGKIMAEAQADLVLLYQQKIQQFPEFVQLRESYAKHCGDLREGYGQLKKTNNLIATALQQTVKRHDKGSLAKKLPASLFRDRLHTSMS